MEYHQIELEYLEEDKKGIKLSKGLRKIPDVENRRGGKRSYADWSYVVGLFHGLLHTLTEGREDLNVLDVGCGTGLLGLAVHPFVQRGGQYTGLDVNKQDIDFCRSHYADFKTHRYVQHNVYNRTYAKDSPEIFRCWEFEDEQFDVITALSVWTHLKEEDALFYFKEVDRVLKPGGLALITFFVLDDMYDKSIAQRENGQPNLFNNTNPKVQIFDTCVYQSADWWCPRWAKTPEQCIGVTPAGLAKCIADTNLTKSTLYPGSWKNVNGMYFQDLIVFGKAKA